MTGVENAGTELLFPNGLISDAVEEWRSRCGSAMASATQKPLVRLSDTLAICAGGAESLALRA